MSASPPPSSYRAAALALATHAGPHVFVDDIDVPVLADDDRHHLTKSLRLRPGDQFSVADGDGRWRSCRFGPEVEEAGEVQLVPVPPVAIAIGFALVKGGRPEFVVQKLTELGVDRIVPFRAERSVVVWDAAKAAKNEVRLARVAREAAMQSHRSRLPIIEPVADFDALAAQAGTVRADFGGADPHLDASITLIGPEGGWSEHERRCVPATVSLGVHVLRAETAAIAAGTLLSNLRGKNDHPSTT